MDLLYRAPAGDGLLEIIPTGDNRDIGLALFRGTHLAQTDPHHETALVILAGACDLRAGRHAWTGLGERRDVFSGRATAVYVPAGTPYEINAASSVEIALCRAAAPAAGEPFVVGPGENRPRTVGRDTWRREVVDIIGEDQPAQRLVLGETYNEPGSWSSYVPHKHDVDAPPDEVRLQEIYHYRLQPPQGFGLQRVYSPERAVDVAFAVQEGDSAFIPFGYHPVVAAGGYRLYYLWFLAGSGRTLRPRLDENHRWVEP
ncbi:MAG TPA: 5-deoxy-glucuronate isomerase [Chloroflexota bacterium]|nr:5-deoxy-glucuronate isomerase [Chloroflexota bacterium]